MYAQIWTKYLPIIRILLKRTKQDNQVLDLNRIDFERMGTGRKAGYKFTIEFKNGKVANLISSSASVSYTHLDVYKRQYTYQVFRWYYGNY